MDMNVRWITGQFWIIAVFVGAVTVQNDMNIQIMGADRAITRRSLRNFCGRTFRIITIHDLLSDCSSCCK